MDRDDNLMQMRELLDQMGDACGLWQAADESTERYYEESLRRDLAELRRLCHVLRSRPEARSALSVA